MLASFFLSETPLTAIKTTPLNYLTARAGFSLLLPVLEELYRIEHRRREMDRGNEIDDRDRHTVFCVLPFARTDSIGGWISCARILDF